MIEDCDGVALLAPGRAPLSYRELRKLIRTGVEQLRNVGIGCEDVVAVGLPNGAEMAAAFLVCSSAGVCAPLNPELREAEHRAYLAETRAKAVLTDGSLPAVEAAARALDLPVVLAAPQPERPAGWLDLRVERGCGAAQDRDSTLDDIALILPTSGTTARPKLVPLTHRNLWASARNIRASLALTSADRCLNMMPLFHIHGLAGALLATISAKASIICTGGFAATLFGAWLAEWQPTWYSAVPTIHQSVLRALSGGPSALPARLRFVRSCSASLPPKIMHELETLFQAPVVEAYGMTEAAHQVASNPLGAGRQKPGSVGQAAGPEIMVADDQGLSVPPGVVGEVLIRGENVMRGYLRNETANRDAYRTGGWFRTGDEGRLDEDGYLFLTARTKELINRGGEKIAPREIEEALLEHRAVAQAAAFAIPHPTLGEQVGAAVVLKAGCDAAEHDLRAHAAQTLAAFKTPAVIRVVAEIPKGPTGKVQRIGLAKRLGLEERQQPGRVAPRGALEERVAELWRDTLRVDCAGALDDFFELGGDSLSSQELMTIASIEFGVRLPRVSIYENPTPRSFARVVETAMKTPAAPNPGGLIPLQDGNGRPALFCAPGHRNGFGIFCRAARHLQGRPVFGFPLPALNRIRDHYDFREYTEDCIEQMRAVQPRGPYYLAGHCLGGLLCFEVARELESRGETVGLLCLIETYLEERRRAALTPAGSLPARLLRHFRIIAAAQPGSRARVLRSYASWFWGAGLLSFEYAWYRHLIRHQSSVPQWLLRRELAARLEMQTFQPTTCGCDVLLVRTDDHRPADNQMGWQQFLRRPAEIVSVPLLPDRGIGSWHSVERWAPRLAAHLP